MKKLVIALMAFALVITLAGCGGGGGGGFTLDRGDNGEGLIKNGFTDVKTAYDSMNSELAKYDKSSDSQGTNRAKAIMKNVSTSYKGTRTKNVAIQTYTDLKDRLEYLIREKKFEGLEIIPFKTLDGATEGTEVFEKTKLYVQSLVQGGGTWKNQEYVFEKVQWKKESDGWKILSGLDDLGKTSEDF